MAFGRKPFTTQPQYAVEIDSSHPSASGLVRCNIANARRDLSLSSVRGELLTQTTPVPSLKNKIGLPGTNAYPVSYTTGYNISTNTRQTFLFSGVLPPNNNNFFVWFRSGSSGEHNDLFFNEWSGANSAWFPRARLAGTDLFTTPSLLLQPHTEIVIALRVIAGVSVDIWWGGVQKLSTTTTASFANQNVFNWGAGPAAGSVRGARELQGMWVWNRALADGELSALTQNPWQLFRPVQNNVYLFAPPSAGITGTLNVTEADDTLASTGALAIAGSLAVTEADDTLAATGVVTTFATLNVTEADDTLAATGALAIAGSLSVTEAGDTLASTGTLSISGSLAVTEDGDTLTATGALAITGTLAVTEDDDTLAAAGTSAKVGTLNVTEEGDTLTATATVTQLIAGGGPGKTKRQRGWANERAQLEASIRTETAAAEVKTATKILRASESESARRVAALVREYESARATLEQLRDEVERLRIETERSERLRDEVETAAKVVEIFAQEEEDFLALLEIIDEMEARALLAIVNIAA